MTFTTSPQRSSWREENKHLPTNLLVGFGNQRALRTDTGEGVECLLQTGRKFSQLKNKIKTQ